MDKTTLGFVFAALGLLFLIVSLGLSTAKARRELEELCVKAYTEAATATDTLWIVQSSTTCAELVLKGG